MARNVLILGLFLTLGVAIPFQAQAFSEDLCVGRKHGDLRIGNCLTAKHCSPLGDPLALCRANVVFDAAFATIVADQGLARSMIHVDVIFVLSLVAGLTPDAAYWLAAYNEVADVGGYVPFGFDGHPIRETSEGRPLKTAVLNGWSRSSSITGGFAYHIPPPFKDDGETLVVDCSDNPAPRSICGMHPNMDDWDHEGMLLQMRNWAFGDLETPVQCTNGFTFPMDGNYFQGDECYMQDWRLQTDPESVDYYIYGEMPTLSILPQLTIPFEAYSGNQVAQYTQEGKFLPIPLPTDGPITNVVYADSDGLYDIVERTYGSDLDAVLNGYTIEEYVQLIRMGLYLHILQDRISHHQCGDRSYVSVPGDDDRFEFVYDDVLCSQDKHALMHFEEIGHDPLPDRVRYSLTYAYEELSAFALAFPQWTVDAAPGVDRTQIIDALLDVLKEPNGCRRLKSMIKLQDDFALAQMPGNSGSNLFDMCNLEPTF